MVSRVFKIKGYQGLSRVDTSVLPGWPDGRGILTSEEPPPEAGHFFFCFHLPASILHLRRPRSLPVKSLHPVLKLHAPLNLIMITPKAGPFFFLLPSLFSLLSSLFSPNEFRAVASIFHLPSPIFPSPSEKQRYRRPVGFRFPLPNLHLLVVILTERKDLIVCLSHEVLRGCFRLRSLDPDRFMDHPGRNLACQSPGRGRSGT